MNQDEAIAEAKRRWGDGGYALLSADSGNALFDALGPAVESMGATCEREVGIWERRGGAIFWSGRGRGSTWEAAFESADACAAAMAGASIVEVTPSSP